MNSCDIEPITELLTDISESLHEINANVAKTAVSTKKIRQDVSGIRIGDTGPKAVHRKDPLSPSCRRQVDIVKKRYAQKRLENPNYSLLSISKSVRREDARDGIRGGYATDLALNSRASTEIKREDLGQPPY